mmetsp:Transcript_11568/g.30975  ORF Transcript_11568/g.30975 Transcript_11568/m.30975 type:complete len:115 (-) Transcript_11568:846-1190(-)
MAPEVIRGCGHGRKSDIWSIGACVVEMVTGVPPWAGEYTNEFALMYNIASSTRLPDVPDYLSAECKSFLQLCFQRDAKARPSADELLSHPFLSASKHSSETSESVRAESPSTFA